MDTDPEYIFVDEFKALDYTYKGLFKKSIVVPAYTVMVRITYGEYQVINLRSTTKESVMAYLYGVFLGLKVKEHATNC